jgi:signal peptidase I
VTGSTGAPDLPERSQENVGSDASGTDSATAPAEASKAPKRKQGVLRKVVIVAAILGVLFFVMVIFVARLYLIPSEAMEPTLHGCSGCVDDDLIVDKLTYRFSPPKPGDVIVFKAPPAWRYEEDFVKRVIAVGGQTVECRADTGLTVDGKPLREPYLDSTTMMADPAKYPCLGSEFGPVAVPTGRLWVMGDNRPHSADSRAHCTSVPAEALKGVLCTGDPMSGTVPVANVIGKARFIVWPPSRWGGVGSVNPQY